MNVSSVGSHVPENDHLQYQHDPNAPKQTGRIDPQGPPRTQTLPTTIVRTPNGREAATEYDFCDDTGDD